MPGILFISGGDAFARCVYRKEQRGYWSEALPLMLEKHGYLAVERAGPSALADPHVFSHYDVVLVARLPRGTWTDELARRAVEGPAGVLVEGPPAEPVERVLGVRSCGQGPVEGYVRVSDPRVAAAGYANGFEPSGRLILPFSRPIKRSAELDWRAIESVPISSKQARAWRQRGWDMVRWESVSDAAVLAEWLSSADVFDNAALEQPVERFPAIVRRGSLVACCFGLFAYLGQRHTGEPFEGPEHRSNVRAITLEILALSLIDTLHGERGAVRARVLPWPNRARWVRTIRHDVDRELSMEEARSLVARHAEEGSSATWHWRARQTPSEAVRALAASPRNEIALHAERVWAEGGQAEQQKVEAASGARVLGSSVHGGPDCFRYQGAPNLLWAERQGHLYSELLQEGHFHPHRFAALSVDGTIAPLEVLCLPQHESFDLSSRPGHTARARIQSAPATWMKARGMLIVMNHPDINVSELFDVLREMPRDGRLDWTSAEAADWWRRTHVQDALMLDYLGGGRFRLLAHRRVHGLTVELLRPDGRVEEQVLDLEGGCPIVVTVGGPKPDLEPVR